MNITANDIEAIKFCIEFNITGEDIKKHSSAVETTTNFEWLKK